MFSSRGGFQYVSIPTTTFGNSANFPSNASQYLSTTSTTDLITWKATSGFTIEYWIRLSAWPNTINPGPGNHDAGATNYWSFGPGDTGTLYFYFWAPGQSYVKTANTALSLNTWQNVCMVATTSGSNTTMSFYVNGVRQQVQLNAGSFADTQVVSNGVVATATPFRMGRYGARLWNGYMDNLRVSNVNRYSGASYTLATGPFVSDASTQLLLTCDGTNGSTTITDSSGFARTITNNSNVVTISNTYANHS